MLAGGATCVRLRRRARCSSREGRGVWRVCVCASRAVGEESFYTKGWARQRQTAQTGPLLARRVTYLHECNGRERKRMYLFLFFCYVITHAQKKKVAVPFANAKRVYLRFRARPARFYSRSCKRCEMVLRLISQITEYT